MSWVDIADFVEQEISSAEFPGGQARVVCEAWSADASSMQVRLCNVISSASVGASVAITNSLSTDASFVVALSPGTAKYRLQVTGVAGVDLFCKSAGVMS